MNLPEIARVRQVHRQPEVEDVPAAVAHAIRSSRIAGRVKPGGSVALTVGSRGIVGIAGIARAAAATLRELGFDPFVVAAMGSHGGGTDHGQRALLAELGVTESTAGCPIRSEMATVVLGTNSFGLPIPFDANAARADGVVLLNRIKPHTSFTGRYESGLLKMLTIGLGKHQGAEQVHKLGLPGLLKLLPEVGAYLIEKTPVALGIALLENARERTARVVAVEPDELLDVEPRLLDEARGLMARLPFDQIDVLLVGELGKNYSGTGLDPNVIGRQRVETMPDLPRPVVTRLAVLDLSVETRGNAHRDRPGRPDDRPTRRRDRPHADAGQLHDLELPDPRPRPLEPAHRPRGDRRVPRHLLADRPGRGADGDHPQHPRIDRPLGHRAVDRRGRGQPGPRTRLRLRLRSLADRPRRRARPRSPLPRQRPRPKGHGGGPCLSRASSRSAPWSSTSTA